MAKDDACENPTLSIVVGEEIDSPRNGDGDSNNRISFRSGSSVYNPPRKAHNARPLPGPSPYNRRQNVGGSYQPVTADKNNVSSFTQRIMSAKLLRFKQLQNQITELSHRIEELTAENKTLKTLQKRQDNALKKFEGSKEQLPQLIKSHSEELRIMNIKFKQLKTSYRDLENKIKQRDSELFNLREQHSHLLALARDKQLGERERLRQKLDQTEAYVKEQREKIIMLEKKLSLQEKSFRHQMQIENLKHKETQNQLSNALSMIENLKFALEGKTKLRHISPTRRVDILQIKNKSRMSLPTPSRSALSVADQKQRNAVSETGLNGNNASSNQQQTSYQDHDDFSSTSSFEEHERQLNIIHSNSKSSPTISQTTQKPLATSRSKQIKFTVRDDSANRLSHDGRVGATNKVSIRPPDAVVNDAAASSDDSSSNDSLSRRLKNHTIGGNNERDSDEYTTSDDDDDANHGPFVENIHSKFVRKMNFLKSRDGSLPSMREEIEKEMEDLMKDLPEPTESSSKSSNFRSSIENEIDKMINKAWTGLIDEPGQEEPSFLDDSSIRKLEISIKSRNDYNLPENEKNRLLEALQEIDERQANRDDEVVTGSDLSQLKAVGSDSSHVCSHLQSGNNNKSQVKSDLIKKIFGESDMVPLVDS